MLEMTMDYFLRRALRRHAGRIAIIDGAQTRTYAELDRRSEAIARYLLAQGLKKQDRVALLLHNRAEFIEAEIGIIKAGLAKVPINNKLSPAEIIEILKDCEAAALVVEPEFQLALLAALKELPTLKLILSHEPTSAEVVDFGEVAGAEIESPVPGQATPGDLYLLRYSGGTTGRPKGIMHSHASGVAIALSVIREYGFVDSDIFLQAAHMSHGQNFVWPGLIAQGATLVIMRRFDALGVLEHIHEHRITRLHMVSTMFNDVFSHPRLDEFDLSSLRRAVYASAPMAPEQIRRLYDLLGPRIAQTYTLSESAVVTTMLSPDDHVLDGSAEQLARLASCGREALDVELRIVDGEFRECPPGEVGEIAIRSPGNMMGYWRQPELTAKTLRDGWVLSGDLGKKDAAGYVFLVDRKDDKIISGGFNVYPREVEDVLYRHPSVREAAVFSIPDGRWGEAIVGAVSLWPDKPCSESELIQFCGTQLAGYKKPKQIFIQDSLPKSSVGKIMRRALRAPFWEGKERQIN
jgi:acyl-CoA synthetase (AMP-forming)/AMP-acid ligase II